MALYYFDIRSNGVLKEDDIGREFVSVDRARSHAVHEMPRFLTRALQPEKTYATIEVRDKNRRTVLVVRGSITVEMR
jgi:hypothetical protein